MSTSMRLKRFGSKKRPDYRIVVMDSRSATNSRTIEEVGQYHPIAEKDKQVVLNVEKIKDWLAKGAQPSDTVKHLLNSNGVTITRTVQE
ncbi:ribosomal protein S16 [Sphaerochaeta pleomorpha str. Grapes]|uniref:Small ribosomal subunit protein bS16 n=1 Tax=Sphaerochaeta pleomorpha (strain ATCC BAA-1885 / DSM 22778 / Grapes) TaxID=158190 RepID=G8QWR0_SPHPG|nr:30S ribosomal protein S16 [Sphaerochaeta pleomorpha]AEV28354.1 ribosomal protein S16 [Sphaerochaeta pleomorpha str. Grapes]